MSKEDNFFADLDKEIAHLVQTTLLGQDLEQLAQETGKSVSLLYQWTYPDRQQKPSFKAFFRLLRNSPQKNRVLADICRIFGVGTFILNGDLPTALRRLAEELERGS